MTPRMSIPYVEEIPDDCTRGFHGSRAFPDQCDLPCHVRLDRDGIECPFDHQRVREREEPWCHPQYSAVRNRLCNQPDGTLLLFCKTEGIIGEAINPRNINVLETDRMRTERIGKDYQLDSRIDTLHVIGGVRLRVPHLPRLQQGLLVGKTLRRHPGKDEVAGPV